MKVRLPVRRRDAEAKDVGELGVERGAMFGVAGRLLGAAGDGLDAASDETDDLARRPDAHLGNL